MGYAIKQATATRPLVFGPLVLSTDGKTPATGIVPVVTLSKDGAAYAANNAGAGGITETGNGFYKVAPNATDSNTLGGLKLHVASGATWDVFDEDFLVVAYDPYLATLGGGIDTAITANPSIVAIKAMADGIAATNVIGTVTAAASATSFTVTLANFSSIGANALRGRSAIVAVSSTAPATVAFTGNVSANTASGSSSTVITLFATSPLPAAPQVGDVLVFVGTGATS